MDKFVVKMPFCEQFILGKHPNMRAVIAKYASVQSKALQMSKLFESEEEMIRLLKIVALELFTVKTDWGSRVVQPADNSNEKIVIFLVFLYGIRFWCESKEWFDFWFLMVYLEK